MTLRECYERFGGDYEDVLRRLGRESMIDRFLRRVPTDPAYGELCRAMEEHRDEDAFRAAHTMKGFCLTLGITALGEAASTLTEALRNGRKPEAEDLLKAVSEVYEMTVSAISEL